MQNVQQKVTAILVEKLGIAESEITPNANFVKDLGIDSLDYAELVWISSRPFPLKFRMTMQKKCKPSIRQSPI